MSHVLRLPLLLSALCMISAVQASAVSDLHARLAQLSASQPLSANVSVSSTTHDDSDGDTPKIAHAALQVSVDSDADGLHIDFSPALLQSASHEAEVNARNKDAPTPLKDLLAQLTPVNVQPMVDFAPTLQHLLDGATLASQRDETHDGKPSHRLVFDVPMPPSASKQMTIKHYTGELDVWLGANGMPMAVKSVTDVQGRKFLISIDFSTTTTYTLRVIGTRLVVLTRHTEESHSVFGHGGGSVIDATLTPATGKPAG